MTKHGEPAACFPNRNAYANYPAHPDVILGSVKATILSVDDERDANELVQFHLTKAGFNVLMATNGREALEIIRSARPDLVLLDLMLPDLDGFGVCEILRRDPDTATTPIMILSAWTTTDSRSLGLEIGALDFLAKPYSPAALVERVKRLLSHRTSRPLQQAS